MPIMSMPVPSPRLIVDLTTAFDERGRIAHGTIRVERGLAGALADLAHPDISFCRFDRAAGRFVEIATADVGSIVEAVTTPEPRRNLRAPWRSHRLLQAGRRLERWVRTNVRDRIRRSRRTIVGRAAPPADIFPPGSWLLLSGELQRQDFAVLMELRRRLGLRLAFVFHDLLGTLTRDDPRANDPNAVDVPSTEFMMREASLILPNSRFSANELARHAAERAVKLPDVQVIRLGHTLAGKDHGASESTPPVEGLSPGHFVITVGDVVARKNHALLADLWTELSHERDGAVATLVIVGGIGREGAPLVAAVAADVAAARAIRFMSNVDDATLRWLYRNCRFTVFPSFKEGFGLPVAESLACGKVCVASNASSIPEASQGAAIHLDPADRPGWREAIVRLLDDDDALKQQEALIASRYRLVTWHDTAQNVLNAIARADASR